MMTRKTYKGTDLLTGAVLQARDILVQTTEEMTRVFKPGAFMTRTVDPRTMDRHIMNMTPEELANVAAADPARAEVFAQRINTLESRIASRTALPAQDSYQPDASFEEED